MQHRPSPHLAYLGADVAETRYDASELRAKEYPHLYPEYLIWHQHGPKAKRKDISFAKVSLGHKKLQHI